MSIGGGRSRIVSARRSAVMPRGGAFSGLTLDKLAAPVIAAALADAGVAPQELDHVILGNALYGGGNPARYVALGSGVPDHVPALSIDTQCCSGLDAILLAGRLVEAGAARIILAGGVESYSRAPQRLARPVDPNGDFVAYDRPPFSPFKEQDPDMIAAAAGLARDLSISADRQAAFTVLSHEKAIATRRSGGHLAELVPVAGHDDVDSYARAVSARMIARSPAVPKAGAVSLKAATVAPEADAAAVVVVMNAEEAARHGHAHSLEILDGVQTGCSPAQPAFGGIAAAEALFRRGHFSPEDVCQVEVMEAFAVQVLATIDALRLDPVLVNPGGGALARGHPIGASGAILAVRLFHDLRERAPGSKGLTVIAAAGGLGSAAGFAALK